MNPINTHMKSDTWRIEADQVCVEYNGNLALYEASLKLKAGCICGLVGMNGAGKSTFFKALMGLFVLLQEGFVSMVLKLLEHRENKLLLMSHKMKRLIAVSQ